MTTTLRVDIASLRDVAPSFADLSDAVDSVRRRLTGALDGEGVCWGTDETGRAFGSGYQPAEQQLRTALAGCAQRIGEIGATVTRVADEAAAADDRARQRLG